MNNPHIVLVIPAFNPQPLLVELVHEIKQHQPDLKIVIVDDGSSGSARPVFDTLKQKQDVFVINHIRNLGKGAAIKSAIRLVVEKYPDAKCIVTADADGQHLVKDIRRICEAIKTAPVDLLMGARKFSQNIPLKSLMGNHLSSFFTKLLLHTSVSDTQTGLRAFSINLAKKYLEIKADGFDFELCALALAAKSGANIREIPIDTVYFNKNRSTNYRAWRDTVKMVKVFAGLLVKRNQRG